MNAEIQDPIAISATGLGKRYGSLWALKDFDLEVPAGSVLGLLGHNGAGKTTAIRILTTLALPSAGSATVAGLDVVAKPALVRERIGLTSQAATVDGLMSASANLVMIGRLYHLPRGVARRRAAELLERLQLADAGDRLVRDFSGGMRRRLDLAASLIVSPPVLFLDEPTTGLDPRGRTGMWDVISSLVSDGTTVLLTTQYLEEADLLADQIVVVDHGQIIARGTSDDLKAQVGGERLEVTIARGGDLDAAVHALSAHASGDIRVDSDQRRVVVPVSNGARILADAVRDLDAAGLTLDDLALRRPTLDDVFLMLTGHEAEEKPADDGAPTGRRGERATERVSA
jgi:ABC-2 type transport system ATP-binding protein